MSFDLNINNYTKGELQEMLELPNNYDQNMFELKEIKLRENIVNNNEISMEMKKNMLNFLLEVRKIMLNNNQPNQPNQTQSNLGIGKQLLEHLYNSSYELKPIKVDDPEEHMLQDRENKPYLSSYPSQYFPGIINPIKKRTTKLNLNVDSRFRDNYYSTSSSNFNANTNFNVNNVLSMQLSDIELPNTFYLVSKQFGNNFFTVKLTDTNESKVVEIESGNYNYSGIENAINHSLSNLGGNFANIVFKINITTNTNTNGSGQMMVGCAPLPSLPFNFELNFQTDRFGNEDQNTPLPLKLGWILGFRNGMYANNQNYVSEGIVDITGSRYIYLVIDDYNNNVNNGFYSAFNSSILNKNILARISIQPGVFNLTSRNNLNVTTQAREYFGPVNFQNFNVQLLDEYGRIFDLNNMDFSFCLTLDTVYDI